MLARVIAAEAELRRTVLQTRPPSSIVIPLTLRRDDLVLELFTTITTVGTPLDITLQELRIETLFPANPASKAALDVVINAPVE